MITKPPDVDIPSGGMTEDDKQLLNEILKRAPEASAEELETFFITLRLEYGEDALHALRGGHIQFERMAR